MGKTIWNEYDDTEITVPEHRNVIAPNRETRNTVAKTIKEGSEAAATVTSPAITLIDHALALIPVITGHITTMVVECQHTAQIKAQTHGQIEIARQETKRIEIQEKNLTERTLIECNKEIRLKEIELQKFRDELILKEKEIQTKHEEFLKDLEIIKETVTSIIEDKKKIMDSLPRYLAEETSLQSIITGLNKSNDQLVELVREIVRLRNGGKI